MSIGKSFEEIMQKGLRMIGQGMHGFVGNDGLVFEDLDTELSKPTDLRMFAIAEAFEAGYTIDRIYELTKIDPWFLGKLKNIYDYTKVLGQYKHIEDLPAEVVKEAKRLGFSDFQIARYVERPSGNMEKEYAPKCTCLPQETGHPASVKCINTVASENPDSPTTCILPRWFRTRCSLLQERKIGYRTGFGCLPHR